MAKAAPDGLITALDIGSSKVSAMIAQKGDGGELIVLGTHGRRGLGRWVMGSSAEHILRHSPVPVLLVRAPEAARAEAERFTVPAGLRPPQ